MSNGPIAHCAAGTFRGAAVEQAEVWKGIRYAAPPVGELRWRAPRPAPPIEADALEFGPAAPQAATKMIDLGSTPMDEDCLFLNVWRPAGREGESLPVMVWIHGGAYVLGATSQPTYDGAHLATAQGVIVVSISYRLGSLGFIELSSLSSDAATFDTNLGLRDVLLALTWVRENIAGFGGDPDRVTVAGESAGGGLVTTLLACPPARGLFSRAIAESSPASSIYDEERAASVAQRLLAHLQIAPEDAATLRDVPVADLVSATMALFAEVPAAAPGTLAFAPVVDGDLLPEHPIDVLRAGRGIPVPLVIGTNHDEASAFGHMNSPLMPVAGPEIMRMFQGLHADRPELPMPPLDQVLTAYHGLDDRRRGLAIARDIAFRLPTVWVAEGQSGVADTWVYRFDRATPALRLIGLGATHATELPYVWGNFGERGKDPTLRFGGRRLAEHVSRRVQDRWGAFIRGERPDAPDRGAPAWPVFGDGGATLVIDREDRVVEALDAPLLAAWGPETLAFR